MTIFKYLDKRKNESQKFLKEIFKIHFFININTLKVYFFNFFVFVLLLV